MCNLKNRTSIEPVFDFVRRLLQTRFDDVISNSISTDLLSCAVRKLFLL